MRFIRVHGKKYLSNDLKELAKLMTSKVLGILITNVQVQDECKGYSC